MKDIFDNSFVLKVIWKWKIHLMAVGAAAIILAAIFSSPFFIEPKFISTGRLYPTNTKTYSEESESEQMIEILNSSDIKNRMIETFNLVDRYQINIDDPYYKTRVVKKYNKYVDCKKTEYESIEINVMDSDPYIASSMVDSLISFYNQKVFQMRSMLYRNMAETYKRDLALKLQEIDTLDNKMESLRTQYGLMSYGVQVEQTTIGYITALAEGAPEKSIKQIEKVMNNLQLKGGEFLLLEKKLQNDINIRDTLQRRYEQSLSAATKRITYSTVVEKPFPADKKSYPVRWLIVFVSLLATEFLALVAVFVLEKLELTKS
ncbi:MAG: hypothetical protein A2W90_14045 [Bacteroidetes bacterium GWF2_42_66]|nr:MAG: hypothetical protein A2W92_21760 [Bacteroidetes bacterium GWA2_42_15]OFX96993.1 MAG: hypothetical protein A2W89_12015 [Bacteroidetes bacterium GWE2_42_39]OFY46007.1 MAG: hypothetical protein A2W90_14045 [Bacteroidetes bacterium GWF2_42_66]HCR92075.1 hypothetical protein [Prolixibacteraceae bacterium]